MKIQNKFPPLHFSDTSENVLITGATGFIGHLLVDALLRDGKQVTILTRHPHQATSIWNSQVQCIQSMTDLPLKQRIDVIINLAGARILGWRWTPARKSLLRKSRIDLTQSLVNWIARAQHKPRLLISTSAIGYYGIQPQNDDTVLTEDSQPQPIFMSMLCQEWEAVAKQASNYGVQVKLMRLGFVLGKQGSLPLMMLPIKLGLGGALGSGKQWLSWIHVQDVLRGIVHLWTMSFRKEAPLIEAFNFTAPEAVRQKQFSQIAASVVRRPCFLPTPAFPVRLALGEQADLLLEGQRVVPAKLHASGFKFSFPELRMALENLEEH
ncbi:MAG: hypothetical protein K0R08_1299 [Solimicrobium sp.]|jgi:uncharacterized protein (TIGR01777 family)|nr:hypothetical protein [Solimicrobium sp.]